MGESILRSPKPAYRSLFWPIVLIGAGVIWLLTNFNIISSANLVVLFRLWPLILIVIGLDLLFGRQSPVIGAVIGIGAVALMVVLMLIGPSLGLGTNVEIVTDTFSEPLGDTESARIDLNTSVGRVNVQALTDSNNLVAAEIAHIGEIDFVTEGESEKIVSISQREETVNFGTDWLTSLFTDEELVWNVNINPEVPVNLNINSGVGESFYDLRDLQLLGLDANIGVGSVTLDLPAMPGSYPVSLNGGTGSTTVNIFDGTAVDLNINGGVGSVLIDIPQDAAVRVDASSGVGAVNLPGDFTRISGDDDGGNFVGDEGVWETEGFNSAEQQITIVFDGGVGTLTLR